MSPSTPASLVRPDGWIKFPGFGLPLDDMPSSWKRDCADRKRFPNAIQDWAGLGVTVRERNMLSFINLITDKPEWDRKVFDEEIVGKWRQEASANDADFSGKMFDFVSSKPDESRG